MWLRGTGETAEPRKAGEKTTSDADTTKEVNQAGEERQSVVRRFLCEGVVPQQTGGGRARL